MCAPCGWAVGVVVVCLCVCVCVCVVWRFARSLVVWWLCVVVIVGPCGPLCARACLALPVDIRRWPHGDGAADGCGR